MFWIIGADGAAKALAEMLSGKGMIPSTAGNIIAGQFEHAEWEGLRFYDLIFPLFIFVTGVTTNISERKFPTGTPRRDGSGRSPAKDETRFGVAVHRAAKHKAVNATERQPLWGFAPQHVELMSKDKDLGFQRSPRPEQSDQRAPDQPAKVAHRQRVSADSRSRSAVLSLR
jgi:hypothetical protein